MNSKQKIIGGSILTIVILVSVFSVVGRLSTHWTITQYGNSNGAQSEFYTIVGPQKEVIVVDGGWRDMSTDIRQVINQLGGHVDYWILTHPHPDHIGAFNEIAKDPQGITIGTIYTIPMDYDAYQKKAKEWDEFEVYDEFTNLAKTMNNIQYVAEGDSYEIAGLKMQVLNAYTDSINQTSNDLCNDGSMAFKLTGKKESILFMADVGKSRNDHLLENYADILPSKYIQMAHHGYSHLSDEFYQSVNPEIAFFDCHYSLIENDKTTTGYYWQLMQKLNAKEYNFETAPNQVKLY